MEIAVRYVTRFRYRSPVWDSHNALRACPRSDDHQRSVRYELAVEPTARLHGYVDRWGTRVDTFGVRLPHDELVVDARASLITEPRPSPAASALDDVAAPGFRTDRWLFTQPSPHTRWTPEMAAEARGLVAGIDDATEVARTVMGHVHDTMDYVPGATRIGVDPAEVWSARAGVCQDYAHLTISFLRSLGLPARYVSGYFYAADPADGSSPDGDEIVVQTHAWVEAAIPGFGWWGIDPTNCLEAGERHVVIGHGRDYDDVTPLRGVYHGDTDHELAVAVTMGAGRISSRPLPDVPLDGVDQ